LCADYYYYYYCGSGRSVSVATELGVGRSGLESRWGRDFRPSRRALGSTQPPVKWVPGLSLGKVRPGRASDH